MRPALLAILLFASSAFADFKRLHAERATASSFLESNWNKYQENYHPTYVLDDDAKTAWVEGADGDGVGESLTVQLSALKSAKALRLVLTPGYQKSKALFAANGVPTTLGVTVRDVSNVQTAAVDLTLKPTWGTQTFDVPVTGGLASVTVTVKAVRPGATYRDTCLSDVQFFVDSDTPYDPRVEEAKRSAMVKWKVERLATAKYFALLPKTYPFASVRYRAETVVDSKQVQKRWRKLLAAADGTLTGEADPKFRELVDLAAAKALPPPFDADDAAVLATLMGVAAKPGEKWFTASAKSVPKAPDGLNQAFPAYALPFMSASEVSFFESKAKNADLPRLRVQEGLMAERRSDVALLEGTPTAPRLAAFRNLRQISDRVEYQESTWVLVRWAEDGRLERVASLMQTRDADGGGAPSTVIAQVWRLEKGGVIEVREARSWNGENTEFSEPSQEDGLSVEHVRYLPVAK
jgi:hypothetical protein